MRKVLLATTALVGVAFSGAAYAAMPPASPISLNVGGYVDFVAGQDHESDTAAGSKQESHDFETEFKLSFDALGKASNGIEYGANVSLWNGPEVTNESVKTGNYQPFAGSGNQITVDSAYVWLSGAFGKALFGDEHGASDLFVYAPTVGEGQIDGRYMDFVDPTKLARFQPSGIDNTEHSTKITYYTPKVGNDMHRVQLGVSYTPNMYDYGQNVTKYDTASYPQTLGNVNAQSYSPYQDVVKGAVEYWGNFHPVNVVASAQVITGSPSHAEANETAIMLNSPFGFSGAGTAKEFTAWGLGTQAMWNGFTFGGSYMDLGSYDEVPGQNHNQTVWSLGAKYEFDKVSVAANWLTGEGYDNELLNQGSNLATTSPAGVNGANFVSSFNAYGVGAAYTWFPGLTSNIDGVLFQQSLKEEPGIPHNENDGYVFLVSQRLTF